MSQARTLEAALRDFRRLDLLAGGNSWVHRLDARAKVLVTAVFMLAVVSFDRYALGTLLPFGIFPVLMAAAGGLPATLVLRRTALVIPFALAVGMFNPLFDREVALRVGPVVITAGWISCASILLRSLLAGSAAVVLVATTGFTAICAALARLGLPRPLVVQLLFLYRYLQLLGEEAGRLLRARELRAGGRGISVDEYGPLAGQLLLRTWQRAERIYLAMLVRGFDGSFPLARDTTFGLRDAAFVGGWLVILALLRLSALPQALGSLVLGPGSGA